MRELRDQDLILYYYGEARDADAVRRRLDADAGAGERYAELCRLLELVESQPVPEPWDDYGERVWRRLEPQLDEPPAGRPGRASEWLHSALAPRRLAAAASVALLVALAFLAGRFWPAADLNPGPPRMAGKLPDEGRERILRLSVGEHLERSQMLLVELVNAPPGGGRDLSAEPRRARELLLFNRLYRQAARRSGQAAIAELLDELERLLLDVSHGGELTATDLDDLRQRIESGGILFRVQVVGSRIDPTRRQEQPRSPDRRVGAHPSPASGDV